MLPGLWTLPSQGPEDHPQLRSQADGGVQQGSRGLCLSGEVREAAEGGARGEQLSLSVAFKGAGPSGAPGCDCHMCGNDGLWEAGRAREDERAHPRAKEQLEFVLIR